MFENLKNPFADDLFESLKRSKGSEFTDQVKRAVSDTLSDKCPAPKKCESRAELASWFSQFGRAARAALPKKEAA